MIIKINTTDAPALEITNATNLETYQETAGMALEIISDSPLLPDQVLPAGVERGGGEGEYYLTVQPGQFTGSVEVVYG